MSEEENGLARLSEEVHRLKFTLDHAGAYVFTKDIEGRYTYANDMVCELFGQRLERVIGCTDEKFFDLDISDELRQNDLRVMQNGERVENEERNIIAETGEERFYWSVKIPIRNSDGVITGLCGISTDITERRRLESELAEQKNLLSLVLENMDAFVYMKDRKRRYRYVNEKVANLYKRPVEDIVGQLEEELLPEAAERFAELDNAVIKTGKKVSGEEVFRRPDGEVSYYWSIKMPIFKDGDVDGLIGISTDITEVILLKNEFRDLARIDNLTGVLTRGFLLDYAEKELARTSRREARLAILLIDIDRFKQVNDTYGHAFGDECMIAVVGECKKQLRESDAMGRLGGDEYIVVINDVDEMGMAASAERFLQAVRGLSFTAPNGNIISPTISIGAVLSKPSSTIDQLIADADIALYKVKESGRNNWQAHS
ncbi:diguanylate cyclase [Vibrio sp. HN007]|uniref:sensor domain-containing diguanylate cyclase n=1 Tax=Vibrio iocasae TaxID=3098914 RepID=UPI0035D4A7EB